jgi:hypothetical protein
MLYRKPIFCCGFLAVAATIALGDFEPTIYSRQALAERDAHNMNLPLRNVYEKGAALHQIKAVDEGPSLTMSTSGINIMVLGLKNIVLSRSFRDDQPFAWKEYVSADDGGSQILISVSPTKAEDNFIDIAFKDGRANLKVSRLFADEVKNGSKSELAAFDLITAINRRHVTESPWPKSAELLGLLETYAFSLLGSSDNLHRVDNGDLIIFIGIQRADDRLVGMGQVFDRQTGRWLGSILSMLKPKQEGDTSKILSLLSRVRKAIK